MRRSRSNGVRSYDLKLLKVWVDSAHPPVFKYFISIFVWLCLNNRMILGSSGEVNRVTIAVVVAVYFEKAS